MVIDDMSCDMLCERAFILIETEEKKMKAVVFMFCFLFLKKNFNNLQVNHQRIVHWIHLLIIIFLQNKKQTIIQSVQTPNCQYNQIEK